MLRLFRPNIDTEKWNSELDRNQSEEDNDRQLEAQLVGIAATSTRIGAWKNQRNVDQLKLQKQNVDNPICTLYPRLDMASGSKSQITKVMKPKPKRGFRSRVVLRERAPPLQHRIAQTKAWRNCSKIALRRSSPLPVDLAELFHYKNRLAPENLILVVTAPNSCLKSNHITTSPV
ncbi:Hypothetical predicted protein [Prunus dulcis]|uniref:Uncharacterized protein n=1 Tax=Prunus dulcis TaxID=3755 RepID=A0A5E4EDY9_PRUDU|nr:Hypothetical predicted protein [Prunus dulcis]